MADKKKIDWKTTLAGLVGAGLTGAVGVLQVTEVPANSQGWMLLGAAVAQGALGYLAKDK